MILIFVVGIAVLIIIVIFAFPRFSPVPYFPSNEKDMPLILDALRVHNNQTIIDLGAGDGIIIFKAAELALKKKINTKFIAVEINPILLLILHIRRLLHPNRKNIAIINANMFFMNYSSLITNHYPLITFYIYISPWHIEKTINNIAKQIKVFDVVSYFYQVKYLPKHKETMKEGVHKVYRYYK